jgi:hypothetical protein
MRFTGSMNFDQIGYYLLKYENLNLRPNIWTSFCYGRLGF